MPTSRLVRRRTLELHNDVDLFPESKGVGDGGPNVYTKARDEYSLGEEPTSPVRTHRDEVERERGRIAARNERVTDLLRHGGNQPGGTAALSLRDLREL